jgi:hypothetical protein
VHVCNNHRDGCPVPHMLPCRMIGNQLLLPSTHLFMFVS